MLSAAAPFNVRQRLPVHRSTAFAVILAAALQFTGAAVHGQPVPPPIGDITVDKADPVPLEEVKKLIAAGQNPQALARADRIWSRIRATPRCDLCVG